MVNNISDEKRSHIMSCICSRNNKVELMLRKELWNNKLRYRTYYDLPGKPDIVFIKKRLIIFVDGDFWHGYDFEKLKPRLKNEFWVNKIKNNIERDKKVNDKLNVMGWNVLRIWEHEIRNDMDDVLLKINSKL